MYYAAHKEGVFLTPREALAATGAPAEMIDAAMAQAHGDAVLMDFGSYSALATPDADGSWGLWRAFIREAEPTMEAVRQWIKQFPKELQRDTWGVFEFTPGAAVVH